MHFLLALALAQAVLPAQAARALRPDEVSVRAKVLERRNPPYVGTALTGNAGEIRIEFVITPDGAVGEMRVSGAADHAVMAETLAALRRWRFEPAQKDGVRVPSLAMLVVEFATRPRPARGTSLQMALTASLRLEGADDDFGKGTVDMSAPGVVPPKVLKEEMPQYPNGLRDEKQGVVEVEVVVSETGAVREARIMKSADPRFEPDALRTARLWRFAPATRDGKPIAVRVVIQLDYRRH